MQRAPHPIVPGKRRIHRQRVANKYVIRIEIGQVVEGEQRIVESDPCNQQHLRGTRNHGSCYLGRAERLKRNPSVRAPPIQSAPRACFRPKLATVARFIDLPSRNGDLPPTARRGNPSEKRAFCQLRCPGNPQTALIAQAARLPHRPISGFPCLLCPNDTGRDFQTKTTKKLR